MEDADGRYIRIPKEAAAAWKVFLDDFNATIAPVFEAAGYSRDAALTAWFLDQVNGNIIDVEIAVYSQEEDEDWKGG